MLDFTPFRNFEDAARSALAFLRHHNKFDLWMVTRRQGDDWIILQVDEEGYGISEGSVFCWADSYCSRMILGKGPQFAADASQIAAYVDAPISGQLQIGAYVGVPLHREDGSLFGTLCAINAEPVSPDLEQHMELFTLLARMLATQLESDMKRIGQQRLAERFQHEAVTDVLTGLRNRRGWEEILIAEESRSRRHGNPACVIAVDLDDLKTLNDRQGHSAGDELLRRTASSLGNALRGQDVAARVGGDEFTVLGIECDSEGAAGLYERIQEVLLRNNISASVGLALRNPRQGLMEAWQEADRAMYAVKHGRRLAAPHS